MCRNEKDTPNLSPTSQAINALLAGEYSGMNVPEVLKIISPEKPVDVQTREVPKTRSITKMDPSLVSFFSPEELDALNK
ncbi:MAG: hypothetical protein WC784_03465 [Candidatus Shapirobacteria bacterium]|jgi:hypothetical protein